MLSNHRFTDVKDEKEAQKPEEATKLQNGDSKESKDSKESVALAAAATASGVSDEKKKAKTRFMFNIADGGFTGARTNGNKSHPK